ncbi:MAG: DNA polymerase IV [Actinobacteria bacterium]|nr:DNA polymerase IV [Actinomycetota bacterium]
MDAFFASAEIRRRPELRGRPVVVGGDGRRGVVAAASYEARAYGVHSAMPSVRARRLCPGAVFIHGDHAYYAEVSRRIMAILRDVTPLVEPLSLDEAFCDVTGAPGVGDGIVEFAERLRSQVRAAEGLECAVGVATNKFIAKLASKRAKPRVGPPGSGPRPGVGVVVVAAGGEHSFLAGLPVDEIWGVGPATLRRLAAIGVATIGDLAAIPPGVLEQRFGTATGAKLSALARGVDDRPVVADRPARSIGHEETFAADLVTPQAVATEVLRLADATAERLREHGLEGRTVQLKIRYGDFTTITRSQTLGAATSSSHEISRVARRLLAEIDVSRGIRLAGVSVANLAPADEVRQLSFDVVDGPNRRNADRAVEAVRDRFGPSAIASAALLGDDGIEVRRRGDQQWGRSDERR